VNEQKYLWLHREMGKDENTHDVIFSKPSLLFSSLHHDIHLIYSLYGNLIPNPNHCPFLVENDFEIDGFPKHGRGKSNIRNCFIRYKKLTNITFSRYKNRPYLLKYEQPYLFVA